MKTFIPVGRNAFGGRRLAMVRIPSGSPDGQCGGTVMITREDLLQQQEHTEAQLRSISEQMENLKADALRCQGVLQVVSFQMQKIDAREAAEREAKEAAAAEALSGTSDCKEDGPTACPEDCPCEASA